MQIDWLIVGVQWLNFLLLMWLLKRFLYRPILDAMSRRQQNIESQFSQIQCQQAQADASQALYQQQLAQLEQQRSAWLAQARSEAETERARLLAAAKQEISESTKAWRAQIDREKTAFQQQLQQALAALMTDIARKVLLDLTDTGLEQALVNQFIQRLPSTDKNPLQTSLPTGITLLSSSPLSADLREQLTNALQDWLDAPLALDFALLPAGEFGLVLQTASYHLSWRLEDYFADLDKQLANALAMAGHSEQHDHAE